MARVQIAAATRFGNSLRQTVDTHRASVHQAAKLVAALLKTGFNGNFFIWQCKGDYWIRALLQLEKIFVLDDFDAERYCDQNCREPTWQCRKSAVASLGQYSWLSGVFCIRSSLLENPPPDSWLSWGCSLLLDCDVIGIGGSEWNSRKASTAQLSVDGGACILNVTTADCAESHEYTEVDFDVTITKNN